MVLRRRSGGSVLYGGERSVGGRDRASRPRISHRRSPTPHRDRERQLRQPVNGVAVRGGGQRKSHSASPSVRSSGTVLSEATDGVRPKAASCGAGVDGSGPRLVVPPPAPPPPPRANPPRSSFTPGSVASPGKHGLEPVAGVTVRPPPPPPPPIAVPAWRGNVLAPGWVILVLGGQEGECYYHKERNEYQWEFPCAEEDGLSSERLPETPAPPKPPAAFIPLGASKEERPDWKLVEQKLANLKENPPKWERCIGASGACIWLHNIEGTMAKEEPSEMVEWGREVDSLERCLDPGAGKGHGEAKLPWHVPAAGPASSMDAGLELAKIQNVAELDEAMRAWREKQRQLGGDGRTKIKLTFTTKIGSKQDLHATIKALGIEILQKKGPGAKVVGASPPYAVVTGDDTQPGLDVTYDVSPKQAVSFQLQNKRQFKVVLHGTRHVLNEQRMEDIITFFGPVLAVSSGAPDMQGEEDVSAARPFSIRARLALKEGIA